MAYTLGIASELGVIGRDPECADASNPSGEMHGEIYFVTAADDDGRIFSHCWITRDEGEARDWMGRILKAVSETDGWSPEGREAWRHWRNAYGSAAYDGGDEAEREKRDALDEEIWRGF